MHIRGSRSLGIAFLLLVFAGCNGIKSCADKSVDYSLDTTNQALERVDKSLGTEEDKTHKPVDADFVIEGEKVFYKGKLLPVFGKIEEWIAILGDKLIRYDDSSERDRYIWNELGVFCLCDKGIVKQFEIVFRNYKEKDLQEIVKGSWPTKYYEKDIVVDGAVINKNTPVSKLNQNKKGEHFEERYTPTTYDYSLPFGKDKWVLVTIKLTCDKEVITFSMNW